MNVATSTLRRPDVGGILVLFAALTATAAAYAPGLGGSIHFDDAASLDGAAAVTGSRSLLEYLFGGTAGPLGRPLALATFVPQAYAWPASPEVLLWTNVCLHLLNGALVTWFLYLLALTRDSERDRAAWLAAMSGAIWMLLPLLASSSLLIVQRMTTLSATFSLLGLIGYLYARRSLASQPRRSLTLMTVSIGAAAALATLAKENGALLPLLVLVCEVTLLPGPRAPEARRWSHAWNAVFLGLPALALLVYLLANLSYGPTLEMRRGFTGPERLLTEARILWQYLFHAFFPSTAKLGPFHDDYPVYRDWLEPLSMLAAVGWSTAVGAAFALRRRAPMLSFAIGWYLVGHALESTTLSLELYFEHRNYLPLIGPVFGVVVLADGTRTYRPVLRLGMIGYAALLGIVLLNTTSLWGRPALAAEMWAIAHPNSSRATQYIAKQYEQAGDRATTRRIMLAQLERDPSSAVFAIQALALSCLLEPGSPQPALLAQARANLAKSSAEPSSFEALRGLYRIVEGQTCAGVDRGVIYDLAAVATSNAAIKRAPTALHNFHLLMAEEDFARRNLDRTMHHLEAALAARYNLETLTAAVRMLQSAGLDGAAETLLEQAVDRVPRHPLKAIVWRDRVDALRTEIQTVRNDHAGR